MAARANLDSGSMAQRDEGETVIQMDGVAVRRRVFTAERKLKKPRPLSHTPLAPKLHGPLHSTHKQPAGSEREQQAGRQAGNSDWPFYISTIAPRREVKLPVSHVGEAEERRR